MIFTLTRKVTRGSRSVVFERTDHGDYIVTRWIDDKPGLQAALTRDQTKVLWRALVKLGYVSEKDFGEIS